MKIDSSLEIVHKLEKDLGRILTGEEVKLCFAAYTLGGQTEHNYIYDLLEKLNKEYSHEYVDV